MDTLYYIHFALFTAAAMLAFIFGVLNPREFTRKVALGNCFALSVSALTYLSLVIFPAEVRWLGYTLACATFAYETTLIQRSIESRAVWAGGLMAVTLFTGFLGYFASGTPLALIFAFGSLTYVGALILIACRDSGGVGEKMHKRADWLRGYYMIFFIVVWSIYPIVYALGPVVYGVIDKDAELIAYFILEFPAKFAVAFMNIGLSGPLIYFLERWNYLK